VQSSTAVPGEATDAAKAEVAAAQKAKQDAEKKLAPLKEQVQALLGGADANEEYR